MATDFPTRKLKEMTRVELLEEVKHLRIQNYELQQQVQQAEHVGRHMDELLQAIRLQCAKHRREKNRLERLYYPLRVAYVIIVIIRLLLVLHADILALDEYGASSLDIFQKYFSTKFRWLADDKIGSIFIAILGFSIAVPSQFTFPAPYLSFAAASLFTIKQMIIIFLSKYCIGLVTLFAIGAILALDFDRKKQIKIEDEADVMSPK